MWWMIETKAIHIPTSKWWLLIYSRILYQYIFGYLLIARIYRVAEWRINILSWFGGFHLFILYFYKLGLCISKKQWGEMCHSSARLSCLKHGLTSVRKWRNQLKGLYFISLVLIGVKKLEELWGWRCQGSQGPQNGAAWETAEQFSNFAKLSVKQHWVNSGFRGSDFFGNACVGQLFLLKDMLSWARAWRIYRKQGKNQSALN